VYQKKGRTHIANQDRCRKALEDIANQANQIFTYRPPATYEEAMAEAEAVAAKIRQELAEKDARRRAESERR
jgi:hypothetical protein